MKPAGALLQRPTVSSGEAGGDAGALQRGSKPRVRLRFSPEERVPAYEKNQLVLRLTIGVRVGIISYATSPGGSMLQLFRNICKDEQGQDIAEYAVMLAVILVLVIGTVRLIGGNANNVFSSVASSIPQ